ncbi:MAG: tRNA 5-methoxyuridine(34)/uridine 5-oxyacetic acid(34) synthase CmoB [Hydrogenovibrio sp.]
MKHYHQHYTSFWPQLNQHRLDHWHSSLPPLLDLALDANGNGNLPRWQPALDCIMQFPASDQAWLNQAVVTAGSKDFSEADRASLTDALRALMPWRKGPFTLEGIHIDTEWRSDWKWDRVAPHLAPLEGRKVLDIGCGSGYHLWRMLGEGAELAIGVDPSLLFMTQFLAVKHFVGDAQPAFFLPLTLEQLPAQPQSDVFDTVFSMGVLYHRRSPIDHILDLKRQLRSGGELVLETLVVPDDYGQLLVPSDRYAQMNNVWFIPSVAELQRWLEKCGFKKVRCVDLNQTSIEEQRATEWMEWNSLQDFLDPSDPNKTLEGYPAPRRAVLIAEKP